MIEYAIGALREAGLPVSIAGGNPSLANHAPLVKDANAGLGPLSGVCAALSDSSKTWAVFIPVDLPLLPAALILFLLQHARTTGRAVTLASINGFPQTFPAVLRTEILPVLLQELEAGGGGCFAAFQAAAAQRAEPLSVVSVEMLVQAGRVSHPRALPAARWFLNVNAKQDLRRADAYLQAVTR